MSATRKPVTRKTPSKVKARPIRVKKDVRAEIDVDVDLLRELAKRVPNLSKEEIAGLISDMTPLRRESTPAEEKAQGDAMQQTARAPRTDDELWEYIKRETGYEIPRVSVCDDHCAPFDPIADAYFNRSNAELIMASREAGKTIGVAILHYVNAETKPGCEGLTFGAILPQAKRAYRYIKDFIFTRDEEGNRITKPQIQGDPTREKTEWKTGSSVEIVVGTQSGVNSPHPQVVHADELDLMEEVVFAESRNMASSKTLPGGKRIPALDIITSTRKSTRGLMQKLLDETEEAKKNGHKPPWDVYAYCFKEAAAEVPMCRCVDPVARVRRLIKLGLPPSSLCRCDTVVKSEWSEGVPRTLESVCRGDLFRSRGWLHIDDIERKFMQNSQAVWEAQMECRRPMADGLYLPSFSRPRHTIRGWIPRPEHGRIFSGIDWGGTKSEANNVVLWIQGPLHHPVEIMGFAMKPIVVPQGGYVIFDELFVAGVGATRLADMVVTREVAYRNKFPGFRVRGRFPDQAGAQQKNDWHEHSPPLRTQWYITRDFDPTVETLQQLVGDNLLYVDILTCPEVVDDFESWRQKAGREVSDNCLVAGTMIATERGAIPIEDVVIGDRVHTRNGLRRVTWSGRRGLAPTRVKRLWFSDGSSITGTDEHPVWTQERGFVPLAAVRYGDTIVQCQEIKTEISAWSDKRLSMTDGYGIDTLMRPSGLNAFISLVAVSLFIDSNGLKFGDRFPKDMKSITEIWTPIITSSTILFALPRANIQGFTICCEKEDHTAMRTRLRLLRQYLSMRTLMLARSLDLEAARHPLLTVRDLRNHVSNVCQHISQCIDINDSVLVSASRNGVETTRSITNYEFANIAEKNSQPSNILLFDSARVVALCSIEEPKKEWVYDLSVEDEPEFFANGVLVHNSTHGPAAARYGLTNVVVLERRAAKDRGKPQALPAVRERGASDLTGALAAASGEGVQSSSSGVVESERWRESFGMISPRSSRGGINGWRLG